MSGSFESETRARAGDDVCPSREGCRGHGGCDEELGAQEGGQEVEVCMLVEEFAHG